MNITLATLAQATAQEVFDQGKLHLLTQNKKSYRTLDNNKPSCAYRGDDNCKCAAGCYIADDEYDPKIEGVLWMGVIETLNCTDAYLPLISALQRVHDTWDVNGWPEALKEVAGRFGLLYEHE